MQDAGNSDRGDVAADDRLMRSRFPRASRYHPDWILSGVSGGANPLWLSEWLAEAMDLRPGQRVLDLGCGRGLSSIFLCREFGVQVWATDLWFSAEENALRVRDAGVEGGVFPIHADARALPFAEGFFDAVVSIDSFMYYGTDDTYLNYLTRFVRPGGAIGIALAGFIEEIDEVIPQPLAEWWAAEHPSCLHSAGWWRRHWQRSGIVDVALADTLPDGWRYWRDWTALVSPDNTLELGALDADAGRCFGYVRAVSHRRAGVSLFDPALTIPATYTKRPLLRDQE